MMRTPATTQLSQGGKISTVSLTIDVPRCRVRYQHGNRAGGLSQQPSANGEMR
jgi:hypothetical protein